MSTNSTTQTPEPAAEAGNVEAAEALYDRLTELAQQVDQHEPGYAQALVWQLERLAGEYADTETDEPEPDDQPQGGARLRIEKCSGEMLPLVKWLLARSFETKLATVALYVLQDADTSNNIQRNGLYDGEIGKDLALDWRDEVFARVHMDEQCKDPSPTTLAALIAGIDAASA